MEIPVDPLVCDLVKRLDVDLREDFEERAAIIEYDAGFGRAHAECLALLGLLNRRPLALSAVRVLEFELNGVTRWMLATDFAAALKHVGCIGGFDPRVVELDDVVETKYRGLAALKAAD